MTTKSQNGISFERRGVGEPLVLIHGTGGSRAHWRPVADLLAPRFELLLVDLPGHGDSDPPPAGSPHTPPGYARLLAQLLDELGVDSAHVGGNSVGGWTALEFAKLGRARSVVALAPAGLWRRRNPWRCVAQLWLKHKAARLFAPLVPPVMRSGLGRTVLLSETVAKPRQVPPADAIELVTTYARTRCFDTHLAATRRARFRDGDAIDVPVTVAWGNKERLIPTKARLHHELPAHTRFVTLEGCGHMAMWDDPVRVAALVSETAGARRAA